MKKHKYFNSIKKIKFNYIKNYEYILGLSGYNGLIYQLVDNNVFLVR
jgi:hypothetical protein